MSLTNAEKLQAISSPWANYITLLEKTHLTIDGGLIDKISFDDSRGRAFQNVAQLVYCCAGLPATQRIPTAAKLEKWLTSQDERPSDAFKYAMADVLGRLWELACSEELDAPFCRFKAKVAPVEFVYIGTPLPMPSAHSFSAPTAPPHSKKNCFFFSSSAGVLLYVMRQGYSVAEQSRAAFILRRDIRKAHVDVRFNSRVAADCWSLIDAIENGEIYIEQPPSSATASAPIRSSTRPTTASWKRKSLDSQSTPSATQRKSKRKKA
jgi:hypothetical protein